MLDVDDQIEKAKRHYCRTLEGASIPSNASYYDAESDQIVLVNVHGVLAKYEFKGERIKQVEYDPRWNR